MENKKKVVKRSVLPLYLAAAVWLLNLLVPAVSMIWFLLRGIVFSALVLVIGKCIWKNQVENPVPGEADEPPHEPPEQEAKAKKSTGNPTVDKLMEERDRAISEMRRLNEAIEDPTISRQIDEVEDVTEKIFDHVAAHPEKLPQIRKFLNYYLPTTLKLLNAYDRMGAQGVSGENIDSTMKKVEEMMERIVVAFRRQLDELFGAEAMDIKSDIQVLEMMMVREGLLDGPMYSAESK